jgi:hypothetical protein
LESWHLNRSFPVVSLSDARIIDCKKPNFDARGSTRRVNSFAFIRICSLAFTVMPTHIEYNINVTGNFSSEHTFT